MLKDFSRDTFDIIIQAGQSNAEGCGIGKANDPFEQSDRVWYLNGDFTICQAQERIWGNNIAGDFSLSFAREYIKSGLLAEGRNILIVRSAVGGTGFSDNRWGMNDDLYLRMINMVRTATGLNKRNKPVAFLWHQGETDAANSLPGEIYLRNLTALVGTVRSLCGRADLPFINGNFVREWIAENEGICEPIIGALRKVCADIGCAGFVETDGLLSNMQDNGNDSTIHFCREALYQLGQRYFKTFHGITGVKEG